MLGRVRACSLSSLEVLEMERTPSKLLKDDSLSIYETTLMKLKQGSKREISSTPDEALMAVNAPDCPSTDSFTCSGDCQSMITTKARPQGNLSVVYLFSRYKSSRHESPSSPDQSAMAIEDDCSSASTSSDHSTNSWLFSSTIMTSPTGL